MRPIILVTLLVTALLGVGVAYWVDAGEQKPKRHYPKPTPPPDPSPIYTDSRERAPSEEEIAQEARDHNGRLAEGIESALASKNARRREAAFTFLLPELVQVDPQRVAAMVANERPGELRDTLRTEVTRQWVATDLAAAVSWMQTLPERERRASALAAIDSIEAYNPADAKNIAELFGVNPR